MMGTGQSLEWTQNCTYGVREWMLDLEATGIEVLCFLDHGALLPELNVSLLQAPMADSVFTVLDLKFVASTKANVPIRTEKQSTHSVSAVPEDRGRKNNFYQTGNLQVTEKLDLPKRELNQSANLCTSMESNKITDLNPYVHAASIPASISERRSLPVVAGQRSTTFTQAGSPLADVITLSTLLERIADSVPPGKVQQLQAPPANGNSAKASIAGEQRRPPSAIISSPEAFGDMCKSLAGKSSSLLADWISHSPVEKAASDLTGSSSIKNALLKDSASPSLPRDAATLDALAGAALEAWGSNAIAEERKTGEMREGRFLTALDRLVDSLSNFENRMAGASLAKTGQQLDSGEVLWLEEDELASKLEKILKRQARRRGIDLS